MSKALSNHATKEDRTKLLAELDASKTPAPVTPPTPTPAPVEPPAPPTPAPAPVEPPTPPLDPVTPPTPTPAPQTPPAETPEQEVARLRAEKAEADRKFSMSSREAQMLGMRDRIYNENIEKAKNLPLPSDDECKTEYGEDWENLDPVTQKLARESLHSKKKLALIESTNDRLTNEQAQITKVRSYAVDPDVIKLFPVIEGHEDEFEKFALKPSRLGMDLEDVASLFNAAMAGKSKPAPAPGAPTTLFAPNSSVSTPPSSQQPAGLDAGKAELLRRKDQKSYNAMLKKGKIKPSDLLK